MKKFFKYIFVAVAALCLGANAANASNAANFYYEGGSTGLRRWFTWHWNYENNQPMTGAKGLLMINAVTDSHANNEVFVHVKKVGDRYRFYCNEECTIECIGLGVTNDWNGFAILWTGIYNIENETDHAQQSFIPNYSINEDDPNISSPKDITEFLYMITNAAAAMQKKMNELPSDIHAPYVKNLITTGSSTDLQIHFCLHNTYELTSAESRYAISDFMSGDGKVKSIDFGRAYVIYDGVVQYPRNIYFERSADFVGSDSDNALLSVNPDYTSGASASNTYYINFSVGHVGSVVQIDNKTSNDSDVAVRVNHNGLFMMQNVTIKNSVSGNHGVGVKLASGGTHNYHNAAVELGNDQSGLGNATIDGQKIGIDAYAGVIRLKRTTGNVLNDNEVAVSIDKGVMLGKWAKDISSFTGKDVLITLKNPQNWYSGDIVFASGRTKHYESGLNESQYVSGEWVCPLTEAEISHLKYAPETDITNTYTIIYDAAGVPSNVDYEYPVFRLGISTIYNTRTRIWYPTLHAAVNDSEHALADGDVLVYYGNVSEPKAVNISKDITIRSAVPGYSVDEAADPTRTISTDGYISCYVGNSKGNAPTFITVANGAEVTFGSSIEVGGSVVYAPYKIDGQGNSRALDVIGIANAGNNFIIKNCNADNGGAVKIENDGIFNLTDATISGNSASANGAGVYQGGTMTVSGAPVFGSSDFVYLPEGKVITKVGEIANSVLIPVKLANEASGRDILVSKNGAISSSGGQVESSDGSKLSVTLEDSLFSVIYNATGLDGGIYTPTDVIELFLGNGKILIIKDGLKTGDSAVFTVTAAGGANPSYTVVLTGIDDSGSQVQQAILEVPVNTYTVTESGWSWAYQNVSGTSASITKSIAESQAAGVYSEFRFSNETKSGTTEHAESSKNNDFSAPNGSLTGGLSSYNGHAL